MKQVRIAELKARLSEHLRAVRKGETVDVLDRDTLIARIVPVEDPPALRIRQRKALSPPPNHVPLPAAVSRHPTHDIVDLLLEERQAGR